ncbi:MAG: hypothetical protein WC620_04365 [Methanoregula sp.]|jgi:hypothetical protein
MQLRKWSVILLALLLAGMVMVPMVSAVEESNKANIVGKTVPTPETMDINRLMSRHTQQSDNSFIITNPVTYLTF